MGQSPLASAGKTLASRRTAVCLMAAGLSLGLSTAAFATDLPAPAPIYSKAPVYTKAPPPAEIWNWSGFYLGGNVGGATENTSGTSNFVDTGATNPLRVNTPQSNPFSSPGFIGGVQAGYNWQVSPHFVLGAEGDWDWLHTRYGFCRPTSDLTLPCIDGGSGGDGTFANNVGIENIAGQANWLATARARAGVTWDRFMFYGTGGAAWGSIETTESLSCLADGCGSSTLKLAASSSTTQLKTGWVAGLGVEGMLTSHWSLKAEWLHYDLGSLNNTLATTGTTVVTPSTQSAVWLHTERFEVIRVGVNYHFGG